MKAQSYITSRPSTQYNATNAWNVNLNNGNVNNNTKTNGNQVRLISDIYNDPDPGKMAEFLDFAATMEAAYFKCLRTKMANPNAAFYALRGMTSTLMLAWDVWTGRYTIAPGIAFVEPLPVPRECFAATFRDRCVHDWVMMPLEPIFEKVFPDSITANRKGMGTLAAIQMVQDKIYELTNGYKEDIWVFSADFRGFFMTIDKRILNGTVQDLIDTYYDGPYMDILKRLFAQITFNQPQETARRRSPLSAWKQIAPEKSLYNQDYWHGLAIGNLPSQWSACVILLLAIMIIEKYNVTEAIITYMDDGKWLIRDKARFLAALPEIERELKDTLNLTLHPIKRNLQHYSKGWKMCGGKGRNGRLYASDRTLRRMRAKVHWLCTGTHDPDATLRTVNSYFGVLSKFCTYKARKAAAEKILEYYGKEMYFSNDYKKAVFFKNFNDRKVTKSAIQSARKKTSRLAMAA